MAIVKHHKSNFETLKQAFAGQATCLMECRRKSDGATVVMLCAVGYDPDSETPYSFTPFAEMVDGNPFEMYDPPNPGGGFEGDDPDYDDQGNLRPGVDHKEGDQ